MNWLLLDLDLWFVVEIVGFGNGSGVQWPFTNKVTAVPHFMNFKVSQEDKGRKMVSEPLVSSEFLSVSSGDGYDQSRKRSSAEIQVCFCCFLCYRRWK